MITKTLIEEITMEFKIGDKVRVTSVVGDLLEDMDDFLDLVGTVIEVDAKDKTYFVDFGWKYFIDECDLTLEENV
jgi:hypothetical protein